MTLRINDIVIPEARILAEMQYHAAGSVEAAREKASRALAVRELLRQAAAARAIDGAGEEAIDHLLDEVVDPAEPDEATCREIYDRHPERFRSPDLVEAQHILCAAAPDDAEARAAAQARAERLLGELQADPARFAALAEMHSDCPSKTNTGMLGQLTRGSTVPEFETYLFSLDAGEFCAAPVPSRYGFHVLRCLARAEGVVLPFEHVRPRIADALRARAWRRDVGRFVASLAAAARIEGVTMVELQHDAAPE